MDAWLWLLPVLFPAVGFFFGNCPCCGSEETGVACEFCPTDTPVSWQVDVEADVECPNITGTYIIEQGGTGDPESFPCFFSFTEQHFVTCADSTNQRLVVSLRMEDDGGGSVRYRANVNTVDPILGTLIYPNSFEKSGMSDCLQATNLPRNIGGAVNTVFVTPL